MESYSTSTSKDYRVTCFPVIFAEFYAALTIGKSGPVETKTGDPLDPLNTLFRVSSGEVRSGRADLNGGVRALCRLKIVVERTGRGLQDQLAVRTAAQMLLDISRNSRS